MSSFTFVHASDLHLDTAFGGLQRDFFEKEGSQSLSSLLQNASFEALTRLIELCIGVKADFLVLAGDIYNSEEGSLRAHFALRDAFLRLEQSGVQVYIVHGNHDPYRQVEWPDNVHVFGPELECIPFDKNGERYALIHGLSHNNAKESRNLAQFFKRKEISLLHPDCFQLALLHCAVGGSSTGHALYAPCSLADLEAADMDYWALGHVHGLRLFSHRQGGREQLYGAYSGSLQGLHVNEAGLHGALVVEVHNKKIQKHSFIPLAPVHWFDCAMEFAEQTDLEEEEASQFFRLEEEASALLENMQQEILQKYEAAQSTFALSFPPKLCMARLVLRGRSNLHFYLQKEEAQESLLSYINEHSARQNLYLHDLSVRTAPTFSLEELAKGEGLSAEFCRLCMELLAKEDEQARVFDALQKSLREKNKRAHKQFTAPDSEEQQALLQEAAYLCLSLLEGQE